MSDWIVSMIPKFKNWRWWASFPVVFTYAVFMIFPFMLFEFTCEKLHDFSERVNIAHNDAPRWLDKLLDWSIENDKN